MFGLHTSSEKCSLFALKGGSGSVHKTWGNEYIMTLCLIVNLGALLQVVLLWFNSLYPEECGYRFKNLIFMIILLIETWGIFREIILGWMSQELIDDVNLGSGNGLVPSGNEPLPEPLLLHLPWCHVASLRVNELNNILTTYGFTSYTTTVLSAWNLPQFIHLILPCMTFENGLMFYACLWFGSHKTWYQLHDWHLTHWDRDKMAPIFQITFSNAFSLMKMYTFWLKFHWNLFPRV